MRSILMMIAMVFMAFPAFATNGISHFEVSNQNGRWVYDCVLNCDGLRTTRVDNPDRRIYSTDQIYRELFGVEAATTIIVTSVSWRRITRTFHTGGTRHVETEVEVTNPETGNTRIVTVTETFGDGGDLGWYEVENEFSVEPITPQTEEIDGEIVRIEIDRNTGDLTVHIEANPEDEIREETVEIDGREITIYVPVTVDTDDIMVDVEEILDEDDELMSVNDVVTPSKTTGHTERKFKDIIRDIKRTTLLDINISVPVYDNGDTAVVIDTHIDNHEDFIGIKIIKRF